jgi:hypothetical protein
MDMEEEDASAETSVMRELKEKLQQRNVRMENAQKSGTWSTSAPGSSAASGGAFTLDSFTLDSNGVTSALLGIKEKLSYWVNSLQTLMMDSDDDEDDHSSSDEYIVVSPTADGPTPNRQARRSNNHAGNVNVAKEKARAQPKACAQQRPGVSSTGSLATLLKSPASLAGKSRARNLNISDKASKNDGKGDANSNKQSFRAGSNVSCAPAAAAAATATATAAFAQKNSSGAASKPICAMTCQHIQPPTQSSSSVTTVSKSAESASTCTGNGAALEGGISAHVNASRTHALTADGRVYKISVSKDDDEGTCTNARVLEPRKAHAMPIKVCVHMY